MVLWLAFYLLWIVWSSLVRSLPTLCRLILMWTLQDRTAPFPTAKFVTELDNGGAGNHSLHPKMMKRKFSTVALSSTILLRGFSRSISLPNSSGWLDGSMFSRKSSPREIGTHRCQRARHTVSVYCILADVSFSTFPQVDVQAIPSVPPTSPIPGKDTCATKAIRPTGPCVQRPSAKSCLAAKDHPHVE